MTGPNGSRWNTATYSGRRTSSWSSRTHGLEEQRAISPPDRAFVRETGIPLVCTNDAHYLSKEDARMQKLLICIQTNTTVDEPQSHGL